MDEIFRTAFYQRHNIALNVGTDNYSSRLSFSFDNDEGVLINTYNKNYAIRYNGKFDLNKWVSISEDLVWKNTENRSKDTNDAYTGPVLSEFICRQVLLSIIRWMVLGEVLLRRILNT